MYLMSIVDHMAQYCIYQYKPHSFFSRKVRDENRESDICMDARTDIISIEQTHAYGFYMVSHNSPSQFEVLCTGRTCCQTLMFVP